MGYLIRLQEKNLPIIRMGDHGARYLSDVFLIPFLCRTVFAQARLPRHIALIHYLFPFFHALCPFGSLKPFPPLRARCRNFFLAKGMPPVGAGDLYGFIRTNGQIAASYPKNLKKFVKRDNFCHALPKEKRLPLKGCRGVDP